MTEISTMFVAATTNDHGVGLTNASKVWWTGKYWSSQKKLAKRFKTREALIVEMMGFCADIEEWLQHNGIC